ncbi:uncharacterized protein [Battus philenor]|uniref:uncharacterized protein n=1 Tax=Battus philenor TaxID=42288 RepID=UPI0035CEDE22
MTTEHRRSCSGSAPHVTKRLCATIVFFIGVLCIFGGYLLGRRARGQPHRSNDVVSANLTAAADGLFWKSKRISHKVIHHNDSQKVMAKILEAFRCSPSECGVMVGYDVAELVRSCINSEVAKLIRSINNASLYLDSLR